MALVGKNSEKNNQNLMQLIRRVHGFVENPDLEKHRQSQDHIGELLGNSREIQYRPVEIEGMEAEWVSVNRAHMKKYVILHCHGGGYSAVKTRQRLTEVPLTTQDTLQRILLPQVLPISVRFSLHMQSVLLNLYQ